MIGKITVSLIAVLTALLLGVSAFELDGLFKLSMIFLLSFIITTVLIYFDGKFTKRDKLYILLGLFVGALTAANLLGSKVALIWGIAVSVGIFAYPLTFLITDAVAEVYGKKVTQRFIWAGLITQIFVFFLVWLSVTLQPAARYTFNAEYTTVFSMSLRMIFASAVAFLLSQMHDIWAFHVWKRFTGGRHLWLRNNFSTIVSQLIDSLVFMFLAFYHLTPNFTAGFVISITVPYWMLKVVMALLDTPFCYLMVSWLKKGKA